VPARTFLAVLEALLKDDRAHYVLAALTAATVAIAALAPPTRLLQPSALGITKREAEEYASAALLAYLAATALAGAPGRGRLVVKKAAERDLLLTQPVSVRAYLLASSVREALEGGASFAFSLALAAPFLGSGAKAALLLPTLALAHLFLATATGVLGLAAALAGARWVSAPLLAYLAAGVLHSAALRSLSPLLTAPLRWIARPIVLCFTLTEPWWQVLAESLPLAAACAASSAAYALLSGRFAHPEMMKLLGEVAAEEVGGPELSLSSDPRSAIFELHLKRAFATRRHAALVAAATASLAALGFALARFGLAEAIKPGMVLVWFVSVSVGMVLGVAAFDLGPLWFYRVNCADLRALAAAVALKQTVYLSEAALALSAFAAALSGRLEYLLFPLANLPFACASSVGTLAAVALVIPRKRLVKHTQEGLTVPEEWLLSAALASAAPLLLAAALFGSLVETGSPWLPLYLAASFALAALVLFVGVEVAAELLYSRDVAS
jgi:hypothetical protein